MRAFLALIMRGRVQAIVASVLTAGLALVFPPMSYASGAVVSLATLKQGPREGALVVAGSVLVAGVVSLMLVGTPAPALAVLAMSWLPAWLLAGVLAKTRSQGMVLLAAGLLGALAVVVIHVLLGGDPETWWREALKRFFAPALEGADSQAVARLEQLLDIWAPRMTRYFGAAISAGLMLSLVLGRWGHSLLDNPGGFGNEFRALRVGRPALIGCLIIAALGLSGSGGIGAFAGDLLGPVAVVLVFQGLAVAHGVVRRRRSPGGWLVALYLLLVVPPHLALPLVCLVGLVDGWMDFRARARGRHEE